MKEQFYVWWVDVHLEGVSAVFGVKSLPGPSIGRCGCSMCIWLTPTGTAYRDPDPDYAQFWLYGDQGHQTFLLDLEIRPWRE